MVGSARTNGAHRQIQPVGSGGRKEGQACMLAQAGRKGDQAEGNKKKEGLVGGRYKGNVCKVGTGGSVGMGKGGGRAW